MPQANHQHTTKKANQGINEAVERLIQLLQAQQGLGMKCASSDPGGLNTAGRTEMKAATLRLATSQAEPLTDTGSDIVLQLGKELGALVATRNKAEDAGIAISKAGGKHGAVDIGIELLENRIDVVADAIAGHRASSIGGALVSLLRAHALADIMINSKYGENEEWRLRHDLSVLNACFYSVLHVLRQAAPGIYEECAGDYYMGECLDPFDCIEEAERRVAEAETEAGLRAA